MIRIQWHCGVDKQKNIPIANVSDCEFNQLYIYHCMSVYGTGITFVMLND